MFKIIFLLNVNRIYYKILKLQHFWEYHNSSHVKRYDRSAMTDAFGRGLIGWAEEVATGVRNWSDSHSSSIHNPLPSTSLHWFTEQVKTVQVYPGEYHIVCNSLYCSKKNVVLKPIYKNLQVLLERKDEDIKPLFLNPTYVITITLAVLSTGPTNL